MSKESNSSADHKNKLWSYPGVKEKSEIPRWIIEEIKIDQMHCMLVISGLKLFCDSPENYNFGFEAAKNTSITKNASKIT